MTLEQVRDTNPLDRTVAHWAILVDWDLQRQRPYVVVDPYDPEGLLYVSRTEYLSLCKVSASNDLTLIVVARPGSKPPLSSDNSSSSQNSPTDGGTRSEKPDLSDFFSRRDNRLTWRDFLKLRRFVKRSVKEDDGMVTVRSSTIGRLTLLWATQLLHYSAVTAPERRLAGFNPYAKTLAAITQHNGVSFLTARMKIMLFAVYSYVGGNPLQSTEPLGQRVRLSNGLPTCIPLDMRNEIRKGNITYIRIWCSLLNFYRSLKVEVADPETAYAVIRSPKPNLGQEPLFEKFQHFCKEVFPKLVASQSESGRVNPYKYSSGRGLIIHSAAANLRSASSLMSLILDARAWATRPRNIPKEWWAMHNDELNIKLFDRVAAEPHIATFQVDPRKGTVLEDDDDLLDRLLDGTSSVPDAEESKKRLLESLQATRAAGSLVGHSGELTKLAREGTYSRNFLTAKWRGEEDPSLREEGGLLGRLFNFAAPGGKLRTVAICDYWTQLCMRSVHDHLFYLLKVLRRNDATFNQQGTVDEYYARNLFPHWSFDLKAATDTIPLDLYIECLAPFLITEGGTYEQGKARAVLWSQLMTERDFGLPAPKKGEIGWGDPAYAGPRTIRYATGQPMGALSSWASMALVHHALVQFSNWIGDAEAVRSGNITMSYREGWFSTYLVLGDDVDLAKDRKVSLNYQVICSAFGIKIGLAKSLSSEKNFFEFANQRFCPEGNISPLSFMEEVQSSNSWNKRIEYASRIASRFGLAVNESTLVRLTVTARQWQALVPELSGMRPRLILRLLRFILLNPLKPNWHSETVTSIDTILKWLSSLNEALKPLVSSGQLKFIESLARDRVAAAVKSQVARRLASIPESFYTYSYDPFIERWLKDVGESPLGTKAALGKVRTPGINPRLPVKPKCSMSWTYVELCINLHNQRIRKDLRQFEMTNWKALKSPQIHTAPVFGNKYDAASEISLARWVELYIELGNIPNPINIHSFETQVNGVTGVLRTEPTQSALNDHAEALLRELIPAIAVGSGLLVTSVPYYPLNGGQGGSWRRLLKQSLRAYKEWKHSIAACPVLAGLGPHRPVWSNYFDHTANVRLLPHRCDLTLTATCSGGGRFGCP